MTVDQYRQQCPLNGTRISESEGFVVGECADKPQEYVEFRGGQVVAVMTPPEMYERLAALRCKTAPDPKTCRDGIFQFAAEYESNKAEMGRKNRNAADKENWRRFFDGIGSTGEAMSASSNAMETRRPAQDLSKPMTAVCFSRGERIEGLNKLCLYDCTGSPVVITQSASSMCPMKPN